MINRKFIPKDIDDKKKLLMLDELTSKFGMIDYTYFNETKLTGKYLEIIGKVGIWIINDTINKDTFVSSIKQENILKCIWLIFVTLSRPYSKGFT